MKTYLSHSLLAVLALPSAVAFSPAASQSAARSSTQLSSTPGLEQTAWGLDPSRIGPAVRCEGGTRKTFPFPDPNEETVQLGMTSEGRPMNAEIQLWIGPDWTPYTLKTYSEDGRQFPVQALVGTRGKMAEVEIRNVGPMELPLNAACTYAKPPLTDIRKKIAESGESKLTIQGGAINSLPLDPGVKQVRILINTDTRQLNTRIELLNGPNNPKQLFEVFTNNGVLSSLYVVLNTPGSGNTVRIINQAPVEFPAYAYIMPFTG